MYKKDVTLGTVMRERNVKKNDTEVVSKDERERDITGFL